MINENIIEQIEKKIKTKKQNWSEQNFYTIL